MRRVVAVSVIAACALVGCTTNKINADDIPRFLVEKVSEQTGFTPTDVTCPDDIGAETGVTFDCGYTGPDGKPWVAHVKIVKVEHEVATYDWSTEPKHG